MKDKYISFYELSKELMKEEGKEGYDYKNVEDECLKRELERKFNNYNKTKLEYFKKIFGERYKNGKNYSIPIEEKEIVKMAIKEYTSKYYNDVRNKKIPKFEDMIKYIIKLEEAIEKSNISKEKKQELIAEIYGVLELESKKQSIVIYKEIKDLVKENIEKVKVKKVIVNGQIKYKIRDLNDYDAKLLIIYYIQLIEDATRRWNEVCDIVSELRMEEILNISDKQLELKEDFKGFNKVLKKSVNIINEAINISNNEKNNLHEEKNITIEKKQRLSKISELFKK